jgi:hypothetical protein
MMTIALSVAWFAVVGIITLVLAEYPASEK